MIETPDPGTKVRRRFELALVAMTGVAAILIACVPSAPIAPEPTMKHIDPPSPAADGRLPLREWSDNSGQFRVQARLVLILDGKVRLLKATGRTTTVPTERLSAADHAYVDEVVARYGKDLANLDQLAAR